MSETVNTVFLPGMNINTVRQTDRNMKPSRILKADKSDICPNNLSCLTKKADMNEIRHPARTK